MKAFSEESLIQTTDPKIYTSYQEWPKISIVTPSYNQGEFIENTILSILNQNYPNLEYIIIDGGSKDKSVEIIRKYADQLSYWVSEKDNGQSQAINKGIGISSGQIFNWINSDDLLAPSALYHVGMNYLKARNTKAILFPTQYFDRSGLLKINNSTVVYESVIKSIAFPSLNQMGTFWNLNVIIELGGINESLHYIMDLDLWNRFLLKYGQSNIVIPKEKEVIGFFRKHENSKTVTELDKNQESRFLIESEKHYRNLPTTKRKRILSYYHFFQFVKNFHLKQVDQLSKYFWQINPFWLSFKDLRSWIYIIRKAILNRG